MKNKETKTNAMRMLDKAHLPYKIVTYQCSEFIDACQIADSLGQFYDLTFKTLVTVGKSREHFVFLIPIDQELNLKKAAQAVGEKSLEMLHVKDIQSVTGYIRGGCTPIGMKKLFPTVIHQSAENLPQIIISGGCLGTQIHLNPLDLAQIVQGKFQDIIK